MEHEDEPTASQAADIKRVAKDTVHKICSSQVILNLAVAVKELVENSIDAGAKIVEIKIKNYGEGGFEVVDNGSGISEENFAGITAKHCTSKLKEFSDLESIKTFGFRGEALSSLCALSNVSVTTRHGSSEHGTKLIYDHDGKITNKTICARNIGTTVSVNDFFITLPVRRGEFLKNYKKDFGKMVLLLQEYCLVLTDIKIICTNQPKSGAKQTVLLTNGSNVMENIISIFGAKQAKDLIKLESPVEDETGAYTKQSLGDDDSILDIKQSELDELNKANFKIEGFISNIEHTARSSKDRQFFYVNSRPVELKSISKLVNDIYHRYNLKQFPFVYLNIKMDQSSVDVNLSKDKRQVAICNDKILQIAVKKSLLNCFGELPTKFKLFSVNNSVTSQDDESEDEDDKILSVNPGKNFGESLKQWRKDPNDSQWGSQKKSSGKRKNCEEAKGQKQPKMKMFFHQKMQKIIEKNGNQSEDESSLMDVSEDQSLQESGSESFSKINLSIETDMTHRIECKTRKSENTLTFEVFEPPQKKFETPKVVKKSSPEKSIKELEQTFLEMTQNITQTELKPQSPVELDENSQEDDLPDSSLTTTLTSPLKIIEIDSQNYCEPSATSCSNVTTTIESIRVLAEAEEKAFKQLREAKKKKKLILRFKESFDNKKAEAELETEIKKEMFSEMEVLGQFNLGFIIAKLNSDLFIVDQHASDEKYNFETLQQSTKLQTQPLVVPEKLQLTAMQEITLIENLKVFELNGFKFLIDDKAEPGKKVKIHSKPFSKNWEFGKEDVEEMLFMLEDSPNAICRPSRIRSMFASRACRKSVMIGDALKKNQMKKILEHMGELDHPWNCPHGRPTLRYLQNLDFIDRN